MTKRYHFTGVGGVGMAGVAFLLKKSGYDVSGCDLHSSPRIAWLEDNGVKVVQGHSPSHITDNLDVCVFTPAVPKDNPEFLAAQKFGCQIQYRGEALAEIFNKSEGIAVCGTHGKTTTSTFIAKLLMALGEDPSWCIGGETDDFPVAGIGNGPLVIEADESDGTLALYKAKTLVVTSLDYDHPDHFKTYDEYVACYKKAMSAADEVIETSALPQNDWPEINSLVLGEHNIRNARTAVEVALRRGHSRKAILAALPQAVKELPDRRFEQIWQQPRIISDYAHHPAEIKCALSMARSLNPKRLRVMFQPHRYSRTKAFLKEFSEELANADEVVLIPVYPAFEKPILGGDIADLYLEFRNLLTQRHESGLPCAKLILARSTIEAWRHIYLTQEKGDITILLGAGDIIKIVPQVLDDMTKRQNDSSVTRQPINLSKLSSFRTGGLSFGRMCNSIHDSGHNAIIVGAGTNTWFSDCATDTDIVKAPSESNAAKPGASLIRNDSRLAFMAGIPGTVGGWAKMNAGAFGDSFGNYISHVVADGKKIPASECGFGYRTSSISGLITHVELKPDIANKKSNSAEEYLARRRKFPSRTCGSVFKNPSEDTPAGKLLEAVGAKAMKVGGAHVWSEHANVIIAGDGCSSSDILALARLMAARVHEHFGISLQPEIRGLEV